MRKISKLTLVLAALVLSATSAGTALAVQQAAAPASTPIGAQPDGRIAGCVKNTTGSTPAPLYVRRTTGTCGAGFKTVYWDQKAKGGKTGPAGAKGATGASGTDLPYGIATVDISRGGAAATTWATISTTVGSPAGDTASSTFRMTCQAAKAPCVISVKAKATAAGVKAYPRVLIQKSDIDTGAPKGLCEYGDGADNDGGSQTLTTSAVTLPLGIGGSLDCGSTQVRPGSGVVESIEVPDGYYDIAATLQFTR